MKLKRFIGTFIFLATVHYTVQGLIWHAQSLRLAATMPMGHLVEATSWRYISFPVFWMVPGTATGVSFWLIGGLNSMCRALFGSVVIEWICDGWVRLRDGIRRMYRRN